MIYLSPAHHPHAEVKVKFDTADELVDCLIDTGFSAGIALPEKYLRFIKRLSKWKQSFELADGSVVDFDLYKLKIDFGGKIKSVSALFSKGNDALLGYRIS